MATDLKLKVGSVSSDNKPYLIDYEAGTIYFANESDSRSYIYLNGKNVVPRLLDVRNGGLGADFSNVSTYSVYVKGTGDTTDSVASAKGAFYVSTAGDKPKYGTLPVSVGGTGKTSLTKGYLVYGNGTSGVSLLKYGTKGQMVVSSGSAPVYVSPAMSWTAGSAEGPVFNFVFNDTTFTGLAIPSASTSASGIITTGSQSLAGDKTLTGVTYASNVEPRTSGSYSLGKYSSETDNAIWANLIVRNINIYDGNNKNIAKTSYENGTTSTQGYSNLVLGNNTASGTAGNSTGRLRLYGANTGYSNLTYANSTTNTSHVLPAASGTLMVSATSAYNSNSEVTLNIPFYSSTNATSMQLGYNDGFTLLH